MIECFGILNDIIVLALFFPSGQWSSTMKFSAVMAIFNLIVRYNVKSNNQSRQSLAVKSHPKLPNMSELLTSSYGWNIPVFMKDLKMHFNFKSLLL